MRRSAVAITVVLLVAGCGSGRHSQRADQPDRIIEVTRIAKGSIPDWQPARFLPKGLFFASARHGWLTLSGSRALETRDGGRSWRRSHHTRLVSSDGALVVHSSSSPCRGAQGSQKPTTSFWTSSDGYAVCVGEGGAGNQRKWLYATTDGGKTWRKRASYKKLPEFGYVEDLRFFDREHGVMLTVRGGVYATDDGGLTWRHSFHNPSEGQIYWSWPDPRNGYVAAWDNGVYATHDLGRSWQRIWPATRPVSYASAEVAIGSRDGAAIVRSSDGGRSWKSWGRIRTAGTVRQFDRLSARSAVALTSSSWTGYGRLGLFRSDDNGRSWHVLTAPRTGDTDASSVSLSFAGANGLLLDSKHGRLFGTHDAGASWELVRKHPHLLSVLVLDGKHFLAISQDIPCLYSSADGGQSWKCVEIGIRTWGARPSEIAASDSRHIWIAAGDDTIIRTADGGKSWKGYSFPLGIVPTGLSFVSASTGFTSLDDGSGRSNQPALMTRDGGRTWTLLPLASRPLR